MMVIFQPERVLLQQQIVELSSYIGGLTLDIGAGGYDRYSGLFNSKRYVRLDLDIQNKPDLVADAHALPFRHEVFDSIVCTQVFGDLHEPYVAIGEFCRVLKKGGSVMITESQTNELHDEPFDYWRFTRFGFEQLCQSCDLSIVVLSQRGGFFTVLAQQIIRYFIDRFDLYHRRMIGRLFKWPLGILGRLLMFMDHLDRSQANRKHTLGWCILARKATKTI